MARLARSLMVYTPQFLRNGRDWRSCGESARRHRAGGNPRIVLELGGRTGGRGNWWSMARFRDEFARRPTAIWRLYENNLQSQVRAGENARQDVESRLRGAAPDRAAANPDPDGPPVPAADRFALEA
jgi:hypothetical protein